MRVGVLGLGLMVFVLGLAATATGGPSAPAAIPGCAKASLNLVEDGQLSLATDNPAFDPWWTGGSKSKDWEINDPSTGKGYESAVAYGIAKRLGFTKAQVAWEAVPFLKSFAPGKKSFDFYLAQVSSYPERRKAVTFSTSYYAVNQAVAGLKSNPISKVR
jgi:polar amino acid transport system substrate-binding protein